ncbi:MAG: ABC transporter permease [Rhodocyclaceae bacterium]|nr:ABC transporter permease [Rhodocyclaceae bacterium]MBX3670581.1 ABC transporter permease [Rhodocyclaceae bacterium]
MLNVPGEGEALAKVAGAWTLAGLSADMPRLLAELRSAAASASAWNLDDLQALDSVGAIMLWRAWGYHLPAQISMDGATRAWFERLERYGVGPRAVPPPESPLAPLMRLGGRVLAFGRQLVDVAWLLGQLALDVLHLARHPSDIPFAETSANVYKAGVQAMPVTALVGFLIGVVLSYLSALQLSNFGADQYIVNILGIGIVRELGPLLVAVLVAGRSGSAMTAQLGVMRVTEEIDALAAMGISRTLRLVLPKVAALVLAMPLLVVWTSTVALFGGMLAAQVQLDLDMGFFVATLPRVVPSVNLYIGAVKGVVFGLIIALTACHFGLRVRPNTESLAANTTTSVVAAITLVIFADSLIAIATRGVGILR